MKRLIRILKTTIIGGVLFLVPFVVLILVIGKALQIIRGITAPLANRIPVESVLGLKIAVILGAFILLLFCLLAGLFARTSPAKKMVRWLESVFLSNLPGYTFIKNMGEEAAGAAPAQRQQSALIRFDDAWQIGFIVERTSDGHIVVFIPEAPSPWTGGVFIFDKSRVTPLEGASTAAIKCLQRLGEGTGALVEGKLQI